MHPLRLIGYRLIDALCDFQLHCGKLSVSYVGRALPHQGSRKTRLSASRPWQCKLSLLLQIEVFELLAPVLRYFRGVLEDIFLAVHLRSPCQNSLYCGDDQTCHSLDGKTFRCHPEDLVVWSKRLPYCFRM
jgi:hypothetical protein